MKMTILMALMALTTGCISTEHSSDRSSQMAAANPDGVVCKREKPTGSHRSIKVCRTVAQLERLKDEADEINRRARNQQQVNN